jgi:hypothetical protein
VAKVPLNEYSFPVDRIANVQGQVSSHSLFTSLAVLPDRDCFFPSRRVPWLTQSPPPFVFPQLEKLIAKNYYLHQSARDGFRSYLQAYASYSLKKIFDVNALDLQKVGKAFGFPIPPKVCLALSSLPLLPFLKSSLPCRNPKLTCSLACLLVSYLASVSSSNPDQHLDRHLPQDRSQTSPRSDRLRRRRPQLGRLRRGRRRARHARRSPAHGRRGLGRRAGDGCWREEGQDWRWTWGKKREGRE